MRVIIEVDDDAEFQKLDPLLRALDVRGVRVEHGGVTQRTQEAFAKLVAYVKQHPLVVKSLDLPSREERNAR